MVYVGSLDGNFYAIDRATGEERWKYHTELGFSAAAAVADGRVYVGDTDGKFYAFAAADGELLWGFEATAEINSAPNFYKNLVLFGSQDATLYALDAVSGKLAWKYAIGDQIRCSPTVVDGRAMVAGCDGKLHIIRLDDGKEIGDVVIDSPTGSTPAVLGDQVFFGTEGGTFFAIDWRTAKVSWTAKVGARAVDPLVGRGDRGAGHRRCPRQTGPCFPSVRRQRSLEFCRPARVSIRVQWWSASGFLSARATADCTRWTAKRGEKSWYYEAGGQFTASPAVAAGRLVIGNQDGTLYCFGEK